MTSRSITPLPALALSASLALLALASACGSGAVPPRLELSRSSIFGGEPVPPGGHPAVVGLAFRRPVAQGAPVFDIECTGVLIHPRLVLTAGHCLAGAAANDPSRVLVYFGDGVEGGQPAADARLIGVERIAVDPTLRVRPSGYGDYAIAVLAEPVLDVEPLPLAGTLALRRATSAPRSSLTLVGYGRREDGGDGLKLTVEALVESTGPQEMLVGGDGRDACAGDSGAPALAATDSGFVVAGIVSRGRRLDCGFGGYVGIAAEAACWVEDASGFRLPELGVACDATVPAYDARALTAITAGGGARLCGLDRRYRWRPNPTQQETIAALILATGSKSCEQMTTKLAGATSLDLDGLQLRDVSPLLAFPSVERLSLVGNHIRRAAPLAKLPALTELALDGNDIRDAKTLAPLITRGVAVLGLGRQLSNVRSTPFLSQCLAADTPEAARRTIRAVFAKVMAEDCETANERLLTLKTLALPGRGLVDVTPLVGQGQLTALDLSGNSAIADVAPLASLERLRSLDLRGTAVTDVSALDSLVARGLVIKR